MKKLTLLFLTIVPLILLATAAGKRSSRLKQPPAPHAPVTEPAPRPIAISGKTFRLPPGVSLVNGSMKGHNAGDCSCPGGAYRFGPVAENYDLSALLRTLEDKSLEDVHSLAVAQNAIWEVTNGHILSAALADKLARLP